MLYTEEAVFIHVPKTGGMSVTRFLVNALDLPVTVFAAAKAERHTREKMPADEAAAAKLHFVAGRRHGTCATAVQEIRDAGLPVPPVAFSIVREPGSLMVSYFKHMQKPAVWRLRGQSPDKLTGAPKLAVEGDFDTFVRQAEFYNMSDDDIDDYYQPHGFPRLDVVALEHLNEYLQMRFGHHRAFSLDKMEHRNTSKAVKTRVEVTPDIRTFLEGKYPKLHQTYQRALSRPWLDS